MRGRHVLLVLALVVLGLVVRIRTSGIAPAPLVATATLPAAPERVAALPSELKRALLEPAARDPFALTPAAVPQVAAAPAPPPLPPLPVAAPPTHGLTFAGRIVAPDGTASILAQSAEGSVFLRPGEVLASGYRVERLEADAVLLTHAALGTQARLDIPPAPSFERR